MAYFRVCSRCGACLDPGERCDCGEIEEILNQQSKVHQKNKAMYLDLQEQREPIEV